MSIIIPANTLASGGFEVDNSCRFEQSSGAYMHKTPSSAGNRQKWTFSFWLKLTADINHYIFSSGTAATDRTYINFNDGALAVQNRIDSSNVLNLITNALHRDTAAWYHFVVAIDTTQGTAANRAKCYVNGTQITSFATETYPNQNVNTFVNNTQLHTVGKPSWTDSAYYDGYMAEVVHIDGQQLAPDQFGEFDEDSGIWKPIKVSGLTFGTNGFYLDFQASGNLGNDANGGTDLTEVNLAATDQSIDTCTNNFATINSLDNYYYASTLSEGNLKQTCNSGNYSFNTSTFGVSQGKWYVEVKTSGDDMRNAIGITDKVSTGTTDALETLPNGWSYQQGEVYNNSSVVANLGTFSSGNIVGIYLDLDNNELYFAINGSIQNSGTGLSVTASSSTTNGNYFFAFGDNASSNTDVNEVNFGSPSFAISSGNTDANGYGNFEYDPSAGTFDGASKDFYALNTKNLAEFG